MEVNLKMKPARKFFGIASAPASRKKTCAPIFIIAWDYVYCVCVGVYVDIYINVFKWYKSG